MMMSLTLQIFPSRRRWVSSPFLQNNHHKYLQILWNKLQISYHSIPLQRYVVESKPTLNQLYYIIFYNSTKSTKHNNFYVTT